MESVKFIFVHIHMKIILKIEVGLHKKNNISHMYNAILCINMQNFNAILQHIKKSLYDSLRDTQV